MAVTPLVSLEGGPVTLAQTVNQAYDVKLTANFLPPAGTNRCIPRISDRELPARLRA